MMMLNSGTLVGWESGGSGTETADVVMELNAGGDMLVGWDSGGSGTEEGICDDLTDQPLRVNMPLPPEKASESSVDATMTDSSCWEDCRADNSFNCAELDAIAEYP
jgi:hypothetical protein